VQVEEKLEEVNLENALNAPELENVLDVANLEEVNLENALNAPELENVLDVANLAVVK